MTEVHWYVDGCHDPDDPKVSKVLLFYDTQDLVRGLAEQWWHRSGDYSTAFDFVIVKPTEHVGKYPIEVESVPHFVIGKPVAA